MAATKQSKIWEKLTGSRELYSMENRAFNFISFISLVVLVYLFIFDVIIEQWFMCVVIAFLFIVQSILYYNSLVLKKYKTGVFVYAIGCYIGLIFNYYFNTGLSGPTIYVFFLTFQLIITVSPSRYSLMWGTLHVLVVMALVYVEYAYPSFVPDTYPDRFARFFDMASTYVVCIVFICLATNYLKRYYKIEKRISDLAHNEVSAKNEKISKQNYELERINEEKNKMFSIISHDLRSPIDSIKGYLEILSQNIVDPNEKKQIEDELLNQVKYTSDLLQNLLYWSKTQMKGVNVMLAPIKLVDVIDDARNFRLAGADKKQIKLTYAIDKDIEVIADKDMLKIVLRNLVVNAIKFTPAGGEIIIRVVRKDTNALISVRDNGIGIAEEKKKDIFTLKANSTYGTNDEKGIGLGLVLCKEFIEHQNGAIWFESEVGKGSVFYISLPLSKL